MLLLLFREAGKVSSVRLRCLTESSPETRLQRLLYKQRFEEALTFARLFYLDAEVRDVWGGVGGAYLNPPEADPAREVL